MDVDDIWVSLNDRIRRMETQLVDERAHHLLKMDDAHPEVGMGLMPFVARKQAIEQLKAENKIRADYEDKK